MLLIVRACARACVRDVRCICRDFLRTYFFPCLFQVKSVPVILPLIMACCDAFAYIPWDGGHGQLTPAGCVESRVDHSEIAGDS